MPAGRFQAEAHAATIDLSKSKQNERSLKRLHLYRNQSSDNDARKSLRRGSEYHIKEQMITTEEYASSVIEALEKESFLQLPLPNDSPDATDDEGSVPPPPPAENQILQDYNLLRSANLVGVGAEAAEVFDLENNAPEVEETNMPPPPRRVSIQSPDNLSEEVPILQSTADVGDFEFLLGLWCDNAGVTRKEYESLREVLSFLTDLKQLDRLPLKLDTLKRRCRQHLPSLKMRRKAIDLNPSKLPTLNPTEKRGTSQLADSKAFLYFVDPKELFRRMLSGQQFSNKLHFGMAEFVDSPTELWHSFSWGSSIRACSGEYTHYPNGLPIFPSDIVYFKCQEANCACILQQPHLGRVCMIARDMTSKAAIRGEVRLTIQLLVQEARFDQEVQADIARSRIPSLENEWYLAEKNLMKVPTSHVLSQEIDVLFDYNFDGVKEHDTRYQSKIVVRRAVGTTLRTIRMVFPPAGELELATYGRQHFLDNFKPQKCICLPYLNFIDGFGLYRNMYRTLMGIYIILSSMNVRDRSRRSNVFAIALGPHGASFESIIESLVALRELDEGIAMEINGEWKYVCAFAQAYVGDMPQQTENSGFKRFNARRGCGKCIAEQKDLGNLNFDTNRYSRSHYETLARRQVAGQMNKTNAARFFVEWGLKEKQSPLVQISPALDLIQTRPLDPAHSELAGLSRALQRLLFEAILTEAGRQAYAAQLRVFPFPPNWGRLQSPLHHLDSYRMSELARASIITPVLLRCWLQPRFILVEYLSAGEKTFRDIMMKQQLSVVDVIVFCFAMLAKSNCVLLAETMTENERANLLMHVKTGRRCYQLLHEAAARADEVSKAGSRSTRSQSPISQSSLSYRSEASTIDSQHQDSQSPMKKGESKYRSCNRRPNVHAGLHCEFAAIYFTTPNNITTFIGEDKHRGFKQLVTQTNYRGVEKTLLLSEVFQQSLRLILQGAYQYDDPASTALVVQFSKSCPTLMDALLAPEQKLLDESEISILEDSAHRNPSVLVAIRRKEAQSQHLPIFPHKLDVLDNFRVQMQKAYEQDYGFNSAVGLHHEPLHYAKKLAFYDKTSEHRINLKLKDYIQLSSRCLESRSQQDTPCRIENIFLHEMNSEERRLFIRVTPTTVLPIMDAVLQSPILQLSTNSLIVGLPAIQPKKLYIVPIAYDRIRNEELDNWKDTQGDIGRGGEMLLQVDADIDFL